MGNQFFVRKKKLFWFLFRSSNHSSLGSWSKHNKSETATIILILLLQLNRINMVNNAIIIILLTVVVISLQNFDVNSQNWSRRQILSQYRRLWDPRLRYRTTMATTTTTEIPLFRTDNPLSEFSFFNWKKSHR